MLVRTFEAHDVGPACRLTNYYIEHTAIHFAYQPASEGDFGAMWESTKGTYPWVAAEVEGRFAGYAKAGQWRAREAYLKTTEVGLYVEPAFHRRGVGRGLYIELLGRLHAAGFHAAIGGIAMPNDASVALHEALGFEKVGVFPEVGRKFDRWHDVGFWQKLLV